MEIEITHVRFDGLQRAAHAITHYKFHTLDHSQSNSCDKASLVQWINEGNDAYVGSGSQRVSVGVVNPVHGAPYVRTYSDGQWTNNLTNLPTF